MVQCFEAECNHRSLRETCKFFRWPTNVEHMKKWQIVSERRADRMPTWNSRLCSCHFVDGRKENGPTIFKVNKYKGTKIKDPKRCLPWRGKRLADVVPALDDTIHDTSSFVSDSLPSMTLTSLHYYLNHKANSTVPSVTPTSMTLTSMTLPSPHRLSRMVNTSMMGENKLLPVTVADTEDMKQQEGTTLTIRYLTGSDSTKMDELENGNDRISVKTEVGTSHMSKDESSHVVMPRRWTVDDCGVLVAVSTDESEGAIKVEKPDLTSETDTEDCDNDTVSLMDASEKTVQTMTLDASATSASKVTVGDNVTVSDSVNIGDNVTIGDEMTVGDKVTVSHNENIAMRKYKCTMCGKAFPHSGMDSVHTGVTPYVCIACDKSYIEVSGVVVHRRTHSGGKPYQCNQCGKLLASTDTLRVHERQHSREKGFKCGTCGKEFRQLCGLNSHTRTHTGEKIYQCERCGKTFRRQCYLKSHEEKQNCNGPFTCFSCGKIFRYSGSLFMHTRERKCSVMAM